MAAGSRFTEDGAGSVLPPFSVINTDAGEAGAASEEMCRLYHELGYLDRRCMLSTELKAGGSIALVRVVKRCIGKVCGFLVHPIVEEQTRINVQQANYLRGVTEQMNRLTEENIRIQKELAELRERLLS